MRCSALPWLKQFLLFIRKRCSSEEGAHECGQVGRQPEEAVSSAGLGTLVSHTVHFPHLSGSHWGHAHTCARPEPRCQKGRTECLGPGAGLAHAQQCPQINPQKITCSVPIICCRKHAWIFKSITDTECEGLMTAWTTLVKRFGLTISTFVIKGDLQNVMLHGFCLKLAWILPTQNLFHATSKARCGLGSFNKTASR